MKKKLIKTNEIIDELEEILNVHSCLCINGYKNIKKLIKKLKILEGEK